MVRKEFSKGESFRPEFGTGRFWCEVAFQTEGIIHNRVLGSV